MRVGLAVAAGGSGGSGVHIVQRVLLDGLAGRIGVDFASAGEHFQGTCDDGV